MERMLIRQHMQKTIRSVGAGAIILSLTGCSPAASAPDTDAVAAIDFEDLGTDAVPETDIPQEDADGDEQPAKQSCGERWHVLDPETAAAIGADFEGVVWKIEKDAFFIAESELQLMEDATLLGSCPAPGAAVPDADLIEVCPDDGTHFYTRTIYDNGTRYEDADCTFQDIKEQMFVELKGHFEDNVFYADEVRLLIVS